MSTYGDKKCTLSHAYTVANPGGGARGPAPPP